MIKQSLRPFYRASIILLLGSFLFALTGCLFDRKPPVIKLQGPTMGTQYHITIVNPPAPLSAEALSPQITQTLERINQLMSTYIDTSEISRFNQSPADELFKVDPETFSVIQAAQELSALSGGAFDITVGPLIELWGFGRNITSTPPSDEAIAEVMDAIGWKKLQLNKETYSLKKEKGIRINLSAIAKGYGVDVLADYLDGLGVENYLVEIGGEIRVKGKNSRDQRWRIGIEVPSIGHQGAQQAIAIADKAVATSGDYRNFYEYEGKRFSHTIDPKTGKPVTHQLASVTVIADNTMMADGLATMFNVLGAEQALKIAEKKQIAVYLIGYNGEQYDIQFSSAFAPYLNQEKPQ